MRDGCWSGRLFCVGSRNHVAGTGMTVSVRYFESGAESREESGAVSTSFLVGCIIRSGFWVMRRDAGWLNFPRALPQPKGVSR